jgi:hypothetical protein
LLPNGISIHLAVASLSGVQPRWVPWRETSKGSGKRHTRGNGHPGVPRPFAKLDNRKNVEQIVNMKNDPPS